MKRTEKNTSKKKQLRKLRVVQSLMTMSAVLWVFAIILKMQSSDFLPQASTIVETVSEIVSETTSKKEITPTKFILPSKSTVKKLLLIVDDDSPIPEDYKFDTISVNGNHAVSSYCYDDLMDMIEDCKARGLSPVICSSYRTLEKQQSLFESEVQSYMQQGHSRETAEKIAATSVAIPDTSEHQLGLAVDIVDINNQRLETEQEDTDVQKWLMANSWKYGFILRYPKDKTDITGTIYEPWHYRYVGKESAVYMHNHNLCLEEFIDFVKAERKAQSAEKSEASANADIKSEEDD